MSLELLKSLFLQRRSLKARFDAEKKLEWEKLVKSIDEKIDAVIVESVGKDKKVSISGIGRMMGTSDFRTASERVKRAFDNVGHKPEATPLSETFIWEETAPETWKAIDAAGRVVLLTVMEDISAVAVLPGSDPELVSLFTDSPEMGFLLWKKQTQEIAE